MTKPATKPAQPARAFEVDAGVLRAALKDVASLVEARNTIPVLSNVLIEVTPHALMVSATDLDAWGMRQVTLDGSAEAARYTVHAATLGKIADKLPAEARVRLAYGEGKLTVSAGRSRFSLPTLPAEDFPTASPKKWAAEFEMPAVHLSGALSTVGFAVSTEETRYYLGGVFLHAPEGADLRFAATDGHRLARGVMALPEGAETLPDIIIPRKIVKVLTGLLDKHDGLVDVRVSRSTIRVEIGDTVVQSKLIDGTFPDYVRVIPAQSDGLLKVDRATLAAAIGRVTTVSSDKERVVKVVLDGDAITLSVSSVEHGMAVEGLECDWRGSPLTIGFNSRYLNDILSHLTADEVEAGFTGDNGAVVWRDRADAAATFVLMPVRV